MNQLIVQAIRGKRLIKLTHKGITRVVEPHAYGRTIKNGVEKLTGYQVKGGHSSKDRKPGSEWFRPNVADIKDLSLLEETFSGPRPDYKRLDETEFTIYEQL